MPQPGTQNKSHPILLENINHQQNHQVPSCEAVVRRLVAAPWVTNAVETPRGLRHAPGRVLRRPEESHRGSAQRFSPTEAKILEIFSGLIIQCYDLVAMLYTTGCSLEFFGLLEFPPVLRQRNAAFAILSSFQRIEMRVYRTNVHSSFALAPPK